MRDPKEHEHLVPGEVALAVQSGRPEFFNILVGRIERGEEIPKEQLLGIAGVCRDLLTKYIEEHDKVEELREVVEDLREGLLTMSQKAGDARTAIETAKRILGEEG